jgi:lysine 2,3-aminomutase
LALAACHRLNTVEDFEKVLPLPTANVKRSARMDLFRVRCTPYFVSLIDPDDPDDPIRKQVIAPRMKLHPLLA